MGGLGKGFYEPGWLKRLQDKCLVVPRLVRGAKMACECWILGGCWGWWLNRICMRRHASGGGRGGAWEEWEEGEESEGFRRLICFSEDNGS